MRFNYIEPTVTFYNLQMTVFLKVKVRNVTKHNFYVFWNTEKTNVTFRIFSTWTYTV